MRGSTNRQIVPGTGRRSPKGPLELYRTLGLIEETLLSRQYRFVNLSLGPELTVEDDDVHAWTSVIDELLSDGDTLMTIAVGNNGRGGSGGGTRARPGARGLRQRACGRRCR